VVYDEDSTSSLVDPQRDTLQYTSIPVTELSASEAAAAAAAVEQALARSAAQLSEQQQAAAAGVTAAARLTVGQRVEVLWQSDESDNGEWWAATVTHVLRNG